MPKEGSGDSTFLNLKSILFTKRILFSTLYWKTLNFMLTFKYCLLYPVTHLEWLKPPIGSMKSIKLWDSLNHSFLNLQCFFLFKRTYGIQIDCKTFCVPQIHCFIEFVKFPLTISLSVTLKTGILFPKLLLIFYNRCSRCFFNFIDLSNIPAADLWIFFAL